MSNPKEESEEGSKLTPIQQQRYDSIFPVYGEVSTQIVKMLTGRGRNSWQAFLDKMEYYRKAKTVEKEYYNGLYETFEIGVLYQPGQCVGNVSEVRREMELAPYTDKIKIQSERDFFMIYVVEEVYETGLVNGEPKKVLKGYRPLIKVKPE